MAAISPAAPTILISFPLGIRHGTDIALPELTEMAVQAREYILENDEDGLRTMLDVGGVPRPPLRPTAEGSPPRIRERGF